MTFRAGVGVSRGAAAQLIDGTITPPAVAEDRGAECIQTRRAAVLSSPILKIRPRVYPLKGVDYYYIG